MWAIFIQPTKKDDHTFHVRTLCCARMEISDLTQVPVVVRIKELNGILNGFNGSEVVIVSRFAIAKSKICVFCLLCHWMENV